jgi:hypothetical protein
MAQSQGGKAVSDLEINIAIAGMCGWGFLSKDKFIVIPPNSPYSVQPLSTIPDYVNDLNAMAEAEQFLDSTNGGSTDPNCLRYAYSSEVYRIVPDTVQPFRASARHRAEAFLRTVGKWKEAKP